MEILFANCSSCLMEHVKTVLRCFSSTLLSLIADELLNSKLVELKLFSS